MATRQKYVREILDFWQGETKKKKKNIFTFQIPMNFF